MNQKRLKLYITLILTRFDGKVYGNENPQILS